MLIKFIQIILYQTMAELALVAMIHLMQIAIT